MIRLLMLKWDFRLISPGHDLHTNEPLMLSECSKLRCDKAIKALVTKILIYCLCMRDQQVAATLQHDKAIDPQC